MKKAFISKKLEDTTRFADEVLHGLAQQTKATVLCLSGDLGSGKTAFAKEIGGLLGISKNEITSPTFVIEKIYQLKTNSYMLPFTHLVHIDAYRLESEHELETLGWKEIISDPHNLILIEWPEMVSGIIPEHSQHINFEFINEDAREITMI